MRRGRKTMRRGGRGGGGREGGGRGGGGRRGGMKNKKAGCSDRHHIYCYRKDTETSLYARSSF
jgi:hypothetical protein